MASSRSLGGSLAAAVLAAAASLSAVAPVAHAQERQSLSERVTRLEQAAQGAGQNVELLNRLTELQQEVQNLRGLVEQQANEIEALKKRSREQYIDLDSRLNRIGSGAPAPAAAPPRDSAASTDNGDGQLQAEPLDADAPPSAPPRTASAQPPVQFGPPGGQTAAAPAEEEKAAYDQAFAALREGRYAESARRFQAFLDRYPDGDLADNALYWLGESYYVTQNYRIALDTFDNMLRRYPQSPKAPDALLKVGYCQFEMKDWSRAEATLREVISRYPDTTVARLAEGRLRALRVEGRH